MIVGLLLLLPLALGAAIGWFLRTTLADSKFSQRDYLKSIIFLFIAAIPVISTLIEGRYPLAHPVSISSERWSGVTMSVDCPPSTSMK